MPRAIIVGGGDFAPALLPPAEAGDLLLAADSGYTALREAGRIPDLCIGDFDSLGYTPSDCPVVTLPVHKDDTDLVAALRLALARGCRDFLLLGVLGGQRLSHTCAAIQALTWLARQGVQACVLDARCRLTVLHNGTQRYPAGREGFLSVLALSDQVRVTIAGLEYPLDRALLTNDFPLGQSNRFTGAPAAVTAEDGSVLILEEPSA